MKFLEFLNESDESGTTFKGVRSSKLNRKGETSFEYVLNPDDKKLKVYNFTRGSRVFAVIALKTEKYDTSVAGFKFEKSDKAGIDAFYNSKTDGFRNDIKFVAEITLKELLSKYNAKEDRVIISEKANKYLLTTVEEKEDDGEEKDERLFAIGYWTNAYGKHEKEYFWMSDDDGSIETKKDMLYYAKRKCEHGQPSTFHDFMSGTARVFVGAEKFLAAAKKVGMNPKIEDR